ncbi:hypothetical protein IEO21_00759 [Rhodonia placenta]|uniref:Mediator of RNA polymerase II transcription subunit 17 n=1 Tax=Rhodonia placenta TaxID=104341 RepID=A0A8H7U6B4_9APHY|nr:hypothetical protein IEO21_00759 [Postia placenta]
MEGPPWKKLRLSLERPYKDDDGLPIPVLLDITPEGQHVYEPKEDPIANVGENLRKIFLERGVDFFDRKKEDREKPSEPLATAEQAEQHEEENEPNKPMTPEELFKMRMDILPQLHIALGEMTQARDLLSLLLSSTGPSQSQSSSQNPSLSFLHSQMSSQTSPQPSFVTQLPPSALTATVVTKQPPIPSVQAFDAQLVVGSKDSALRKAAALLKSAAENIEFGRVTSEEYWINALKIRRSNWGLVPAPLPPGSATGKGADKTTKDFLVTFGLEESPLVFRRRAIGYIPSLGTETKSIGFPLRQHTRLQVAISTTDANGGRRTARNQIPLVDGLSLEGSLRAAQAEVVEQEIFATLIKEASSLPTASARVSERLIVIEAAQDVDLRFELVDSDSASNAGSGSADTAKCDLIFAALHVLLLRSHSLLKAERLKRTAVTRMQGMPAPPPPPPPPMLQPVIDILQYQVFCERIHTEVSTVVDALGQAGVPTQLRFEAVGGSGEEFIQQLRESKPKPIGGEALIRIDNRHSLRFTFLSPSMLIAHLPQATLGIASIPQLSQILVDEIGGCLLKRICEIGTERCRSVNGTWSVDLVAERSVGRWEGCVLSFHIAVPNGSSIVCTGSRLDRANGHLATMSKTYRSHECIGGSSLFEWVGNVIEAALSKQPASLKHCE